MCTETRSNLQEAVSADDLEEQGIPEEPESISLDDLDERWTSPSVTNKLNMSFHISQQMCGSSLDANWYKFYVIWGEGGVNQLSLVKENVPVIL